MSNSPCPLVTHLSVLVSALLLSSACSSSTSLKKTADATTADLAATDLAGRDAGDDAPPADTRATEDILLTRDVAVDPAANEDATPDAWAVADAWSRDLASPDLSNFDVPADGSADHPLPCTVGMNQTCNDNLLVSSIWGTCQPDGTCLCTPGHVVNPETGRCMMAPAKDASASSDSGSAACTGDYTACGCGCCGGAPSKPSCYYPSLGETVATLTAQDLATKNATDCTRAGCSLGIHYVCCAEAAPEPASSATYAATAYSGGLDHVTISKSGSDCATLSLARPLTGSNSAFRISMPASWGVSTAVFGGCGDAGVGEQAKGAVGTFALRTDGAQCLADLHATLFSLTADGNVKSSRLDVDGVVVAGLPAGMCR
jgi:hypothetical protein